MSVWGQHSQKSRGLSTKPSASLLNPEVSPEVLPVIFCLLYTDLELGEIFAQKYIASNLKLVMLISR